MAKTENSTWKLGEKLAEHVERRQPKGRREKQEWFPQEERAICSEKELSILHDEGRKQPSGFQQ